MIIKNFNSGLLITLFHSFLTSLDSVYLYILFDISLIRFRSLKVKLQSCFRDVSVLKVCKLNTNYANKFYKCSGKVILSNVHQKNFLIDEESIWLSMVVYSLII